MRQTSRARMRPESDVEPRMNLARRARKSKGKMQISKCKMPRGGVCREDTKTKMGPDGSAPRGWYSWSVRTGPRNANPPVLLVGGGVRKVNIDKRMLVCQNTARS